MKTFAEYYKDLLAWEGNSFQELIAFWDKDLISEIKEDFAFALQNSDLKNRFCLIRENSTNQSIGNQVEVFAVETLNEQLRVFKIENCIGSGYPDKLLSKQEFKQIALEMKATSSWNPNDSNRRVLTSSSVKLLRRFVPPIFHLICTMIYENEAESVKVLSVRLDFIEPNTSVNVRLEAAVSHKILSSEGHQSIVF